MKTILEDHVKYLHGRDGGKQADFSRKSLRNSTIGYYNFSYADLNRSNLSGTYFHHNNFTGALFTEANF